MALLALGINHKTASVSVREKVAFAPEQMADALAQACELAQLKEVAILSTCNRTELYCSTELEGTRALLEWLGAITVWIRKNYRPAVIPIGARKRLSI